MKRTVSFSLEEDIIKTIENYQKENNLSSKSAALERMILFIKNQSLDIDIVRQLLKENNIKQDKRSNSKEDTSNLEIGIDSCYNDMPE